MKRASNRLVFLFYQQILITAYKEKGTDEHLLLKKGVQCNRGGEPEELGKART
ncbi:hypothetical protein SAMN05878482_105281 [Peribacillus simplex]|uniref:Uncharacterized protein n=1 Tax=Peribacillus simplex TaxID=1478 RepID=A0A9X8RBD1_9BACI|nr:hypothetical protein SAMN05878482_105281 [Peribacillus simplex]